MAVVQDMLDQIRLIQIGKDNPVHHPLHIPDRFLVSRKNQAVPILVLQLFQGVKIPLKQMLVRIGGAYNGHNAVNDLVRAKKYLMVPVVQPHLPVGMSLKPHCLQVIIPIAQNPSLTDRRIGISRNLEFPSPVLPDPLVYFHKHVPYLRRPILCHPDALQHLGLVLRGSMAVVIVQTVIAMPVFLGIHEQPRASGRILAGQTAVVMMLVGQEYIQPVIGDSQFSQRLFHDVQTRPAAKARVHHQASLPILSRNEEYLNLINAFLIAVKLHFKNSRSAFQHNFHLSFILSFYSHIRCPACRHVMVSLTSGPFFSSAFSLFSPRTTRLRFP